MPRLFNYHWILTARL